MCSRESCLGLHASVQNVPWYAGFFQRTACKVVQLRRRESSATAHAAHQFLSSFA